MLVNTVLLLIAFSSKQSKICALSEELIFRGGPVGKMLALRGDNPGSILGQGDA